MLSALAFLAGSTHLHMPHLHRLHLPHVHVGGHAGAGGGQLSWFNFGTHGGVSGMVRRRRLSAGALLRRLVFRGAGGGHAAADWARRVVFWFLAKVLMAHEAPLDPADYDMVGVLGQLSLPIRAGGTGELIYSQEGTRRVTGARSEDGVAIPKGAEVMVTRYEKGIAYVRPWEDLAGRVGAS